MTELARAGISFEEALSWPPIVVQTRISRTDDGGSTAPERQIGMKHTGVSRITAVPPSSSTRRSVDRCTGAGVVSFSRSSTDDLSHDRVLDPVTGKPIGAIASFFYDRFTRDPEEGGDWLRLLRSKGIDLHETYYGEPPKPLHQVEHEIRDAWNRGSKEVERSRERIMDAFIAKARRGEPTYGAQRMFGHEPCTSSDRGL